MLKILRFKYLILFQRFNSFDLGLFFKKKKNFFLKTNFLQKMKNFSKTHKALLKT